MRWRHKDKRVRLIFSSGPQESFGTASNEVFAIIGPFTSFTDKHELQELLEIVIRGYNMEPS